LNITDTEIREWRRIWRLETDHEPLLSATCGREGDDLVERSLRGHSPLVKSLYLTSPTAATSPKTRDLRRDRPVMALPG